MKRMYRVPKVKSEGVMEQTSLACDLTELYFTQPDCIQYVKNGDPEEMAMTLSEEIVPCSSPRLVVEAIHSCDLYTLLS